MTQFHHGITAQEPLTGALPLQDASTNTLGLIATAPDADPDIFPLDTPVLVPSISRVLDAAGVQGTLRRALETIALVTKPVLVVVRVSADPETGSVIGSDTSPRIGIHALLDAKSRLGITPKILGAPELETPDVITAMVAVAKRLRAFVYAAPRDAQGQLLQTIEEVATYRDQFAARELMLIWPEFTSGNVLQQQPDLPA